MLLQKFQVIPKGTGHVAFPVVMFFAIIGCVTRNNQVRKKGTLIEGFSIVMFRHFKSADAPVEVTAGIF